jgi:hypothetical protein
MPDGAKLQLSNSAKQRLQQVEQKLRENAKNYANDGTGRSELNQQGIQDIQTILQHI